MRAKYLILFFILLCAGCNTLKMRTPRPAINKVEPNKAEIIQKAQIQTPQIRKPVIKWRNKKMEPSKEQTIINEVKAENKVAEISKISDEERKKWFDELFPEIKQEEEISDEKVLTLLDKIFVLIGSIGVFATFMTSVYFIATHLLLK